MRPDGRRQAISEAAQMQSAYFADRLKAEQRTQTFNAQLPTFNFQPSEGGKRWNYRLARAAKDATILR